MGDMLTLCAHSKLLLINPHDSFGCLLFRQILSSFGPLVFLHPPPPLFFTVQRTRYWNNNNAHTNRMEVKKGSYRMHLYLARVLRYLRVKHRSVHHLPNPRSVIFTRDRKRLPTNVRSQ